MKDKIAFVINGTTLERIILSAEIPHNSCLEICIPDRVNTIGTSIFKIDYSKSNIIPKNLSIVLVLPESIESILPHAFCWCDSYLKSPVIQLTGPGLDSIRRLNNCTIHSLDISQLRLGKSFKTLEENSIYSCNKLGIIDLRESELENIPKHAFKYCYVLEDIYLPPTLESIHPDFMTMSSGKTTLHLKSIPIGLELLADRTNIKFSIPYKFYYELLKKVFLDKPLTLAIRNRIVIDELENNKLNLKYNYKTKTLELFPNIIESEDGMYNSYSGDLYIPSHFLVGKSLVPIKKIDSFAFCSCTDLISVSIPHGIDVSSLVLDNDVKITIRQPNEEER